MSKKEQAFEYFVLGLTKWWAEQNPNKDVKDNDLSILKVHKLLFFVSVIGADRKKDGLLNVFDKWVAMPYGNIERDIMKMIKGKKGAFKGFTINNTRVILN